MSGRRPTEDHNGLTVRDLVNHVLMERQLRADAGGLKRRTFLDYYDVCEMIVKAFGRGRAADDLQAEDFTQLATTVTRAVYCLARRDPAG